MAMPSEDIRVDIVRHATRAVAPWAPGSTKRFVSDVYAQIVADGRDGGMPLAEFKDVLLELHRRGDIELARADLVAAIDPARVAASEIDAGGATFHFLVGAAPNPAAQRASRITADDLADAFDISPAIIGTRWDADPLLCILSIDPQSAQLRVSIFAPDGPVGHIERVSTLEVMRELADYYFVEIEPVGDDEVVAWTSSDAFIEGARRVHATQLWNELGFLASKERSDERRAAIYDARSKASSGRHGIEHEIRELEHAIAKYRGRQNPCYRTNPTPWVTKILGTHYETLESLVPPAWLPKITKTKAKRTTFTGSLEEFGCGAYGCVLPTLDPGVVLKVTSDESEADFAKRLAQKLPIPICTTYFQIADVVGTKRHGNKVFLLWREEAQSVGKIDTVVGRHAEDAIAHQHDCAKAAFVAIMERRPHQTITKLMSAWRFACRDMGHVDELAFVSEGLLAAEEIGIFISDVHGGNLGIATRAGEPTWIITDPGNVVVTDPALVA